MRFAKRRYVRQDSQQLDYLTKFTPKWIPGCYAGALAGDTMDSIFDGISITGNIAGNYGVSGLTTDARNSHFRNVNNSGKLSVYGSATAIGNTCYLAKSSQLIVDVTPNGLEAIMSDPSPGGTSIDAASVNVSYTIDNQSSGVGLGKVCKELCTLNKSPSGGDEITQSVGQFF